MYTRVHTPRIKAVWASAHPDPREGSSSISVGYDGITIIHKEYEHLGTDNTIAWYIGYDAVDNPIEQINARAVEGVRYFK